MFKYLMAISLIVFLTAQTSHATKFICPSPEELTSDFKKYGAIPPVMYSYKKGGIVFRIINPPDKIASLASVSVIYDLDDKNIKSILCNYLGVDWFEREVDAVVSLEESNIDPKQISFEESLDSADRKASNKHGHGYLWKKSIEFTINPK